jgi:hypothetical protein
MASVPSSDTITLTSANIVYNLYSLLKASEPDLPRVAQAILIQADFALPTGNVIFFGDAKMTKNLLSYGVGLFAGWSWGIDSQQGNLLVLDQMYVYSDANAAQMHVTVVTR